jgi:purine-binding chemotaxis protein CheW
MQQRAMAPASKERALAKAAEVTARSYDLLVVFKLAGQEYGLLANNVREIIRHRSMTRVPNAPPCILGVFNLRGRIVPLFSLYQRLGLEALRAAGTTERAVMVVEYEGSDAGLLVDEVSDVMKIGLNAVDRSAMKAESTAGRQYIEGTVVVGERLITLLRLSSLLED